MIKISALLVALAIGLLAAGVAATSLLLVYVSIGVCLVSAILLVVGIAGQWIAGRDSRAATSGTVPETALSTVGLATAPAAAEPAPVLTAAQAAGSAGTGTADGEQPPAGERASRGDRRSGRDDRRPGRRDERRPWRRDSRPGSRPAAPGPAQPAYPAQPSAAPSAGPDDLWERVAEELDSVGRRQTADLAWPAAEFPLPEEPAEPVPPADPRHFSGTGWPDGPPRFPATAAPEMPAAAMPQPAMDVPRPDPAPATGTAMDGAAASPSGTADVAAAAAGPDASSGATPAAGGESAGTFESTSAGLPRRRPTRSPGSPAPGRPGSGGDLWRPAAYRRETGAPSEGSQPGLPREPAGAPDTATAPAADTAAELGGARFLPATLGAGSSTAGPAAAPGSSSSESSESRASADAAATPDDAAAGETAGAAQEPPEPAEARTAEAETAEAETAEAETAEADAGSGPAAEAEAAIPEAAPDRAAAGDDHDVAPEPGGDAEDAEVAGEAAAGNGRARGPVTVTVVPGVARYHRSGCILIRFLGDDDLETMSRQAAEDASFVPCRACQPDQLPAS